MSLILDDPPLLVDAASGIVLILLGAFAASLRPWRRPTMALAAFTGLLGVGLVAHNAVVPDDLLAGGLLLVGLIAFLLAALPLLLMGLWVPEPVKPRDRSVLLLPAGAALAYLGSYAFIYGVIAEQLVVDPFNRPYWMAVLAVAGFAAVLACLVFTLVLLPLRFHLAPVGSAQRRQAVLLAVSLSVWPGVLFGILPQSHVLPGGNTLVPGFAGLAILVAISAGWLINTARSTGPDARAARNTALWTLAMPLVGSILGILVGLDGPPGVARMLTVLLLAYAILRHQILGIDVKVRWTISKTTLAAIFVAVFFVVSEAAQEFFGARLGGAYVGILAAGLLVFAMAPLSRFADRVAERAVPGGPPISERSQDDRAALFLDMARAAWADRSLTAKERDVLDVARERLGLTAEQAADIEREARKPGGTA